MVLTPERYTTKSQLFMQIKFHLCNIPGLRGTNVVQPNQKIYLKTTLQYFMLFVPLFVKSHYNSNEKLEYRRCKMLLNENVLYQTSNQAEPKSRRLSWDTIFEFVEKMKNIEERKTN